MGRRAGSDTTDVGTLSEPPRDPQVRAFCDALAEILAAGVVEELHSEMQESAAEAVRAAVPREVIRQ